MNPTDPSFTAISSISTDINTAVAGGTLPPPQLPKEIARLEEIAHNLWWSWSPEARQVFRAVSVTLWRNTDHNPVRMLRLVTQDRLEKIKLDPEFQEKYQALLRKYDEYLTTNNTIVSRDFKDINGKKIAYFSAEYGLHGSLPIYSGGLGILAGDHCKTASDLGLDFNAIGFMYPKGYFEQQISPAGEQMPIYKDISIPDVAIERAYLTSGEPALVSLPLEKPDDLLHLQVWLVRVGRVKIYLMDSNLDMNQPWNRDISTRLYGGDQEYRLRQEIALGIGGVRVLRTFGISPDVWHANEGHVAFMLLERLREAVKSGMSFNDAKEFVRKSTIFTTHTPVPAGHDAFPLPLIERYFWHYWPELGIEKEQFFDLGRHKEPWGEAFNMTTLSMNLSSNRNAVSVKHREVTEAMWPEFIKDGNTIKSVTNGVHIRTWLAPEMDELFTRELGSEWQDHLRDANFWNSARDMSDQALWHARLQLKTSLFSFITDRVRRKWMAEGMDPALFVASGKAHPADEGGKQLIREIYQYAKDPAFAGRIAFVENYGMHVAKYLVRGVDVWMNNPKAPLEASGTSGMKAGINGVPNFSILDGWWIEGWNGKNGWGIEGAAQGSQEEQDLQDSHAMYDTLEQQIIPLYYNKHVDGIPHEWLKVVKESIATVIPNFSTERMLSQYIQNLYTPASRASAG